MAKKKLYMTATATAAITAAFFGAEQVDAATHKVKNGDTLWSLAQKYDTTVGQLKQLNNLSSDLIITNDLLEVGDGKAEETSSATKKTTTKTSTSSNTSANTSSTSSSTNSPTGTYTVKSGDTLYSIATNHGMSVDKLMSANNLSSTMIHPGNKLSVNGSSSSDSSSNSSSSANSTSNSSSSNTNTSTNSTTYTVKSGDTLGHIAASQKVSVNQLKSWNNLSSHLIFPGDKLTINGNSSSTSSSSSSNNTNKSSSNKASSSNSNESSSSNSSSSSSSATTYSVKSGDTLGHIAASHGVSVNNLMSWNNLSSHLIFPGDKLTLKGNSSSTSSSSSSNNTNSSSANNSSSSNSSESSSSNSSSSNSSSSNSSSSSSSATTYTVKSGDSLSAIASSHGVSVNNLMSWNNLNSTLIFPGTKLAIKESAKKTASNNSSSNARSNSNASSNVQSSSGTSSSSKTKVESSSTSNSGGLISTAKSVQGTPYVWGGTKPGGFDCSGFIHWAHNNSGKSIPRTNVAGYDSRSYQVSNPQAGDLVFFRGTYGGPNHMSHMGIYLGGGNFIHASSSQGVSIANVNNVYWSQYFDSYKRFY